MTTQQAEGDRISRGAEAQHLLSRLRPYLHKQREYAMNQLIMHHRGETLTEGLMRQWIATLAALDQLEKDLAQRVRLGEQDFEASRT